MEKTGKSDHTRALVPIESWCFGSPELLARGITVDIGLLVEALIYYDQVIFNVSNQPQFASVLEWFIRQNRYDDLLALFRDDTIQVYEYSFLSAPIYDEKTKAYSLWNVQDESQMKTGSFEQRFLYHPNVEKLLPKGRHRQRLYEALRGKVFEAKADDFGSAIETARSDFSDPHRNALIIQSFLNELFRVKQLGRPPEVAAQVQQNPNGSHTVTVNVDFDKISEIAGVNLGWHTGLPLSAGAISNRHLLSASNLNCDLFLPRPMSTLIGDKLFESAKAVNKSTTVIENLKASVEFPDVRFLVNEGRLDFNDIMLLRKQAKKFRSWLQSEAERDRDAIIAYHHEVAKDTGLTKFGRKTLDLFGFIGGGAIGGAVGASLAGPSGAAIGGALGGAVSYATDIGGKIGTDWRPVVFGEWMRDRISQLDKGKD
ncbi:MAG: hypothetical protein ACYCZA_05080 [Thiobacillus sp.]